MPRELVRPAFRRGAGARAGQQLLAGFALDDPFADAVQGLATGQLGQAA